MKYEIWKKNAKEKSGVVYLRLKKMGDGVILSAVNIYGKDLQFGNLIALSEYGEIIRCTHVNNSLGLNLTKKLSKRIKIRQETY
jgi:hypothetical protein